MASCQQTGSKSELLWFSGMICLIAQDNFSTFDVPKRPGGERFNMTCSGSIERKTELNPQSIQRRGRIFECHGKLHISFLKANESAIIIYEHNGHIKATTYHMMAEVQNYINALPAVTDISKFDANGRRSTV
ncbi:hypothetical protein V1509DRAFT_499208 [Lipomyces kononenkoae]